MYAEIDPVAAHALGPDLCTYRLERSLLRFLVRVVRMLVHPS